MINDKQQMLNLPKLILASESPRRSEILGFVGWEFDKRGAAIDESPLKGEKAEEYVQRLAKQKALLVADEFETALVLGADTTVVIDNKIIGKPLDLNEARKMLRLLSGRWHKVLTGVALVKAIGKKRDGKEIILKTKETENSPSIIRSSQSIVSLQTTRVKFVELNDEEIEFLVTEGNPLDKAGAYAVQAQAALFIEEIQGDYWNVVGLPINLVFKMMRVLNKNGND